jgi:hypothetical protein
MLALELPKSLKPETIDACAAHFTKRHKIVKVCPSNDGDLVLSAEVVVAGHCQLPDPMHLAAVMPRLFNALVATAARVGQTLELEALSLLRPGPRTDERTPVPLQKKSCINLLRPDVEVTKANPRQGGFSDHHPIHPSPSRRRRHQQLIDPALP